MHFIRRLSGGEIAVLLTVAVVAVVMVNHGQGMFSPGQLNARSRTNAQPGGVASHSSVETNCAACHASPLTGQTMAARCMECHTNVRKQLNTHGPIHGNMNNALECRSCHTEHHGTQAAITNLATFNHDWAAFPLTGAHVMVECGLCHTTGTYQGTSHSCVSCHAEPQVHLGMFGQRCASCHSTILWAAVSLSTAALTRFDHNTTAFHLTGKHTTTECKACHVNNVFKGTSQACVSCHAEPKVHLGKFGTECASCHATTTWQGATFKHTFPLNHGKRNTASSCATCHTEVDNYKVYTCYGCHEHNPTRIAQRHRNLANFQDCARCHSNGRTHPPRKVAAGALPDLDVRTALLAMSDSSKGCPACATNDVRRKVAKGEATPRADADADNAAPSPFLPSQQETNHPVADPESPTDPKAAVESSADLDLDSPSAVHSVDGETNEAEEAAERAAQQGPAAGLELREAMVSVNPSAGDEVGDSSRPALPATLTWSTDGESLALNLPRHGQSEIATPLRGLALTMIMGELGSDIPDSFPKDFSTPPAPGENSVADARLANPDLPTSRKLESEPWPLQPHALIPFAGILPVDLDTLRENVDAFFIRLARLGEESANLSGTLGGTTWLIVATAIAFEFIRLRGRSPGRWFFSENAIATELKTLPLKEP